MSAFLYVDKIFAPFESNSPLAISLGFAGAILLCAFLFILYDYLMRREAFERKNIVDHLVRENKRQANDTMWNVKKKELDFDEPAQVLGQGTFGRVLLARYRGTNVAVKRVIPHKERQSQNGASGTISHMFSREKGESDVDGHESGMNIMSSYAMSVTGSWANVGKGFDTSIGLGSLSTNAAPDFQALKEEFVAEMRHLSRLRHPCITTVMGT